MLYLVELHIKDHQIFGQTSSRDIVLPSKVHRIKSLFVGTQLGLRTFVTPVKFPAIDNGDFVTSPFAEQSNDTFIGTLSVSLNNADNIVQDMPIYAQSKMKTSVKKNYINLESPLEVPNGSTLRLVMEEKLTSPFYSENLALYQNAIKKALIKRQGLDAELPLTNEYTVKLYLDYD